MLARFSSALQNAVDALAPPVPLHEDFAYHWKRLMRHYLDVTNNKQLPIELTNIPSHMEQLLLILLKEESFCNGEVINAQNEKSNSEVESSSSSTSVTSGPCAEYLVQHSLLDLLVTLGSTDDPPGMRQNVLTFMYNFVTHVKSNLISHTSVFPPIQRLVCLCDGSTPSPTESEEINFLLGLTALVRRNSDLVPYFTSNYQTNMSQVDPFRRRDSWSSDISTSTGTGSQMSLITSTSSHRSNSRPGQIINHSPINNPLFSTPLPSGIRVKDGVGVRLIPLPVPSTLDSNYNDDAQSVITRTGSVTEPESDESFPLLDSVLSYIDSPDASIRLKACQALMLLVSLPDEKVSNLIGVDSMCCVKLATKLSDLYQDIPSNTHTTHIEDLTVSWGMDVPLSPCVSCEGCRQLTAFLSWFDFINQVLCESEPVICQELCRCIKERFLNHVFPVESLTCILNLSIITKILSMSTSAHLISVLCDWLVGDQVIRLTDDKSHLQVIQSSETVSHSEENSIVENNLKSDVKSGSNLEPEPDTGQRESGSVLFHLLNNWSHSDTDVVLETIRLFELLLGKADESVLNRLIFCYLNHVESDPNTAPRDIVIENKRVSSSTDKDILSNDDVDKEIYSLLCILPVELRSGADNGYEQYVSESQRLYSQLLSKRKLTHSFIENFNPTYEYEGPFLTTLYNSIRNIPNQEYQVNLELTSIISRLVIDPDVRLLYLLNQGSGLCKSLHDVASTLKPMITANLDYKRLLKETRYNLLSAPNSIKYDWSGPFECVIVLEELCKELAAISYVKHKLSKSASLSTSSVNTFTPATTATAPISSTSVTSSSPVTKEV